ncbi:YciI family protein [Microbacterium sp. AZCO]|uniref:YciI family protein n=1 Tax=Microbacterium sp. AZCO TaxID=3142976 RepID=UPI0031F4121F
MTGQWLYRIVPARPGMPQGPTDEERALTAAHFEYLVSLRDRGILILAGRTQEDDTFGITIFEASDRAEALRIMDADPGVAGGLFIATLHPYTVAVARDGLVE